MSTKENLREFEPIPRVIGEKLIVGDMLILTAQDCPTEELNALLAKISSEGTSWFDDQKIMEPYSRRKVTMVRLSTGMTVVVKKKREVVEEQEAEDETPLLIGYFTRSVIHEFRTSAILKTIMDSSNLPESLSFYGREWKLVFQVQTPMAAVINLQDQGERYTLFEYLSGESVREEVVAYGGWNYTPEKKRKFFALLHGLMNQIANSLEARGLEPWDLGVHQLIYGFDEERGELTLGIIDTEEYNIAHLYGANWPDHFRRDGLPPPILFL